MMTGMSHSVLILFVVLLIPLPLISTMQRSTILRIHAHSTSTFFPLFLNFHIIFVTILMTLLHLINTLLHLLVTIFHQRLLYRLPLIIKMPGRLLARLSAVLPTSYQLVSRLLGRQWEEPMARTLVVVVGCRVVVECCLCFGHATARLLTILLIIIRLFVRHAPHILLIR